MARVGLPVALLLPLAGLGRRPSGSGAPPPLSPSCNRALDAFCGNASDPELASCYSLLRRRGERTPMLAGLSGPCYIPGHCTARWHCCTLPQRPSR